MWQIWIDTGGTFTDCIAQDPTGNLHRTKVLSSSFLRGNIVEKVNDFTLRIATTWTFDPRLLVGFDCRIVGQKAYQKIKAIKQNCLILASPLSDELGNNLPATFEVTSHEEAPILATRIITQTPLNQEFPTLAMRLGTTKGTNALLERKGAKVLLYVTKGFRDLLRIGTQQRPHLFQIAIPDPTLLYDEVIEITERIDATGQVIEDILLPALPSLSKPHSVAISFLNSYLNPIHEQQLADYFSKNEHNFVSTSASLYAGINYLKRTQTAVVNAYLQPILTAYLHNIQLSLGKQPVQVMSSAGGLTSATSFCAKDSLLSGPAGGMVGAAAIAKRLGFERCLTFDMGGTSTDTARFDDRLDLQYVTKIEGIELHNPTLAIETVAAGGGSICGFDGQKLWVGPDSAGANPGPACYGAGGPLTITDVNLLLGKIDSSRFGIPIDKSKAEIALQAVQQQIVAKTGRHIEPLTLLRGFEQIANEKMAEAIRRISVAKGFNPKDFPLLTFGGAGGLHGCQLAEILGISTVILPYDAGLLSAYGMGQACAQRISTRQILQSLQDFATIFDAVFNELAQQSKHALAAEVTNQNFQTTTLLYLRFKGQESTIEIEIFDNIFSYEAIQAQFYQKYKSLFGYSPDKLTIEVESIKIIVAETAHQTDKANPQSSSQPATAITSDSLYAVYDWQQLKVGDTFVGPAILLNPTSTSFIPANWQVNITSTFDAIAICSHTNANITTNQTHESIELELFTNRFMAIAEEMGAQLQRTAFSVNVKERLDFSCALLDANAELLVNAPHIPVHLGSLGICTRLVREKINIGVGDVIITNHPKYGGSHLPDVTLIAGVFTPDNQLIGYVVNRAHHAEIGGRTPGSMPPDATTLVEEGVVILPTYLVKNGQIQWENMEHLFNHCLYPTRSFADNQADIIAALASLRVGKQALQQLVKQHGIAQVQKYMNLLKMSAFASLQQVLLPYQNQHFEATESLDDGHKICVGIDITPTQITFDFGGTSACHPHNLNANISIIYSAILYVLRLMVAKDIPLNEGLMRQVTVQLPDNSFLHPHFSDDPLQCPAVVGGNTEVSQRLTDTLLKALQLAACSQGTMNNFLFGKAGFGYYETICGGTGASVGAHGRSAVHQHMTNTRITDPEELERRYPIRLEEFAIRNNSGGRGKWQGGDGIVRQVKFLEPLRVTLLTQHRVVPPYGLQGGNDGAVGKQTLYKSNGTVETLQGVCTFEAQTHDSLRIETPGGGGWGIANESEK